MRVLVTGGSGGFGTAVRAALTAQGHRVVGLDLRPTEDAGGVVLAADLRDDASVTSAVGAAIEQLGGLDVLVNNAGVGWPQDLGAGVSDGVRDLFEINLFGAWRTTAAALPALLETRGRVVVIASGLAYLPVPLSSAYSISKRAVSAFADALRSEYGTHLTVATVYPGYVRTPIHARSEAMGMGLEGLAPAEPIAKTVSTIVRCVTAARPPRDTATSAGGRLALTLGRCAPGLVDRALAAHLRRQRRHFTAPVAAGLGARLGGTGTGLPVVDVAPAADPRPVPAPTSGAAAPG